MASPSSMQVNVPIAESTVFSAPTVLIPVKYVIVLMIVEILWPLMKLLVFWDHCVLPQLDLTVSGTITIM